MEKHEVEKVLELQRKAYELLMWIDAHAGANPELLSEQSVEALRFAASCREWVERQSGGFPAHLQVEAADLDAFSHLLSSFFSTSFRVERSTRGVRDGSGYGWTGETRRRLVAGATTKKSKAAREKAETSARALRLIALEELAIENDIDLSHAALEALAGREDLGSALTLWSYAHELVRRSRFSSQGAAVHSLWVGLGEKERAHLTAERVWQARQVLVSAMEAL